MSREAAEAIAQGVAGANLSDLALKTGITELKADICNRLRVMGLGIVGLAVALMKPLPG